MSNNAFVQLMKFFITLIWELTLNILQFCLPSSLFYYPIQKKTVLLTGAAHGIGKELAMLLGLEENCELILFDRDNEGLMALDQKLRSSNPNLRIITCVVDLSKKASMDAGVAKAKEFAVTGLDILINNAGVYFRKEFLDSTTDENELTMNINCMAHLYLVKQLLPDMIYRKKGHIVTISSLGGIIGQGSMVDYCTSKFACLGFTEALQTELWQNDIDYIYTTTVCPFFVSTNLFDNVTLIRRSLFDFTSVISAAKHIIHAIKLRRSIYIFPKIFYYLEKVARFLPTKSLYMFSLLVGINFKLLKPPTTKQDKKKN